MKRYIQTIALIAIFVGYTWESVAQSPCFPGEPLTGTFADPATSSSPNADRVFWLTWGSNYNESISTLPYGKPNVQLRVGSKSYGSIDLGGGRYMCVEAEITRLDVSGSAAGQKVRSYIPGSYQTSGDNGDFLDLLYNRGGSGVTNGVTNNKIASGIINETSGRTVDIVVRVKATTDGEPVRIRGMVVADAEALSSNEHIISSGDGTWTVARVQKNLGKGSYNMSKQHNASGSYSILFMGGNNKRTGAVAFLKYNNSAYKSKADGYAVDFSVNFQGGGHTAIAFGLMTSGYDFGDAPESYGKPVHLIDDITFGSDGISNGNRQGSPGSTVDVNTVAFTPGVLTTETVRYLGSTPPDADHINNFSDDALGDDISGPAGLNEEDAWPVKYRRFADKEYYKPGDKITAIIPYQKAKMNDKISGWIDFDLNGTFDESERVTKTIATNGDGNMVLEWTVPATRTPYSTYVRLRYFGSVEDATRTTGTALTGEVEDHRIYIFSPGVVNPNLMNKSK